MDGLNSLGPRYAMWVRLTDLYARRLMGARPGEAFDSSGLDSMAQEITKFGDEVADSQRAAGASQRRST